MLHVRKILNWSFQFNDKEWCIELWRTPNCQYGRLRYTPRSRELNIRRANTSIVLKENNIQFNGWQGKGPDNILTRTFWKSIKYEKIIWEASKRGLDLYQNGKGVISSSIIPKERHTEIRKKCARIKFIMLKKMAS